MGRGFPLPFVFSAEEMTTTRLSTFCFHESSGEISALLSETAKITLTKIASFVN
jgi:hypothetical protein